MPVINPLVNAQLQKDRANEQGARPVSNTTGSGSQFYLGKITAVNENGTYSVSLVAEDTTTEIHQFHGVFVTGGSATYAIDNIVHLKFANPNHPEIFAAGGGGGCAGNLNLIGVLYG